MQLNTATMSTAVQLLVMLLLSVLMFVMWKRRQTHKLLVSCGLPTLSWMPKFATYDLKGQKGTSFSSLERILPRMKRLKGPYGMYGSVYGLSTAVVYVAHPIPAKQVLCGTGMRTTNEKHRRSSLSSLKGATKAPAYDVFKNFMGESVFTVDGSEWKAKRASVLHALIRNNHRDLQEEANLAADGFLQDVSQESNHGIVENIVPLLQRATLGLVYRYITHDGVDTRLYQRTQAQPSPSSSSSSLSSLAEPSLHDAPALKRASMCSSCDAPPNTTVQSLVRSYLDSVTNMRMILLAQMRSVWYLLPRCCYKFSSVYWQEEENMGPIREFARMACVNARPKSPLHMLQHRSSHKCGDSPLENKHLLDEALLLLFAGHDTSAGTLSWTLHLLSLYPSIQEKLAQEIKSVMERQDRKDYISKKDVAIMPYLDAVVKESMRLYPVAPFVVRNLPHDVTIPGEGNTTTTLPRGAFAFIWLYALHRNEDFWDRPNEFVPERWLSHDKKDANEGGSGPSNSGAYMPFAVGPRNCVGQPIANVVVRTLLARIISHYELTDPQLGEGRDRQELLKDMQAGFTVFPSGGVRLNAKTRGVLG